MTIASVQFATIIAPASQSTAEQMQEWVSAERQHFCPAAAVGHSARAAPVKVPRMSDVRAHWQNPKDASLLQA